MGTARKFTGFFHPGFDCGFIERDASLAAEEGGEVEREAKGVVELEGVFGREDFSFGGFFEFFQAPVQGLVEGLFLEGEGFLDDFGAGFDLGEDVSEFCDESIDEFGEEGFFAIEAEGAAVFNGASQDAAEDVIAAGIPGDDAIGNREAQGADVVGDDAEGDGFLKGIAFFAGVDVDVFFATEFFEFTEDGLEDVGSIVGGLFGKVGETLGVLNEGADAFEAQTGVDVFGGEVAVGAVFFGVVLDEDEVPDLDAEIGVHVDELSSGVAFWSHVDVEFGTRTAGAGVAHFPEIVFDVTVDDVDGGIESGFFEEAFPEIVGFLVEFRGVAFGWRIDGGIEPVGGEAPAFDDEFPGPGDGFFFEVVAEGPVSEHFEKGVVVGVVADILEVVVFAAGADALLGIGCAGRIVGSLFGAEEVGHELVHPGIGEEEARGLGEDGSGGHDGVLLFLKELEEACANLSRSHDGGFRTTFWGKIEVLSDGED